MDYGKYVIIEERGHECAILCNNLIPHSDVAIGKKVVSAGFFDIGHSKSKLDNMGNAAAQFTVSTFGESVTLKVKAREKDANLVHRALFPRGR